MNESFRLRFKKGTRVWRVTQISPEDGVTFDEPDAYPRQMTVEFDARDNPISIAALNRVRSLRGWHPWEFKLFAEVEDGAIRLSGADDKGNKDPYGLPNGYFWCRVILQDATIGGGKQNLHIAPDGSDEVVTLQATTDTRQARVAIAGCDSEIERVLDVPGCVDGLSVADWLASDVRDTRKACLLNLLAVLRVTPTKTEPFIDQVLNVFHVEPDRIYTAVDPSLYERLEELAADPACRIYAEGPPHAPIHQRLLQHLPVTEDRTAVYELLSYRAEGKPSLQVVIAKPPAGHPPRFYADIDLDLGNPLQDVEGFAIHMGELASATETDHLTLWKTLKDTRAGDFLYYTVVNG